MEQQNKKISVSDAKEFHFKLHEFQEMIEILMVGKEMYKALPANETLLLDIYNEVEEIVTGVFGVEVIKMRK
jgi:hypothetical protein